MALFQIEVKDVTLKGRTVRCRRLSFESGRAVLEAWSAWPEDKPLPKGYDGVRMHDGTWWMTTMPEEDAHAALAQAFPKSRIERALKRWPGYAEVKND